MRIEPIITARLKLRGQEKTDVDFVLSIWNDREMGKYLSDPYQEVISEEYHRLIENLGDSEDGCYLIAESRETDERIGTISFFPTEDGKVYDIGYCIHKSSCRCFSFSRTENGERMGKYTGATQSCRIIGGRNGQFSVQ